MFISVNINIERYFGFFYAIPSPILIFKLMTELNSLFTNSVFANPGMTMALVSDWLSSAEEEAKEGCRSPSCCLWFPIG